MSTDAIRDSIELAKLHEQQQHHLAKLFDDQAINNIHYAIQLPEQDPVRSLLNFIVSYIECVPSLIDTSRSISLEAGIQNYTEPFLKLAEDFFLKPPEIIDRNIGLDALMYQAFLAHRLIENINDRFMIHSGRPMVPIDMTMSNLIVHSLIGEPFANELDDAVHYTTGQAMFKEQVYDTLEFKNYIAKHKDQRWQQQQQWPSLTDLPLRLHLPSINR